METSTLAVVTVPPTASVVVTPSAPTATFSTRPPVGFHNPDCLRIRQDAAPFDQLDVPRLQQGADALHQSSHNLVLALDHAGEIVGNGARDRDPKLARLFDLLPKLRAGQQRLAGDA